MCTGAYFWVCRACTGAPSRTAGAPPCLVHMAMSKVAEMALPAVGSVPPPGRPAVRRRRWLAVLAALAVVLGIVAVAPAASAAPGDVGVEGPDHTGTGTPTGIKRAENVLWFNDGRWWANMWDVTSKDNHIFWFDPATMAWVDTQTVVDTRSNVHVDVLWDGAKLYIATHQFVQDEQPAVSGYDAYLYRFSYNSTTKKYTLDGRAVINNLKTETLAIDKDTTGALWATWTQDSSIFVARTTAGNTLSWNAPFKLPGSATVGVDDNSAIIAYKGYLGVMWSSQTKFGATAPDGMYFAIHKDGAADTAWSGPITAVQTPKGSDDHISIKWLDASGGQVYAAVKTSFTAASQPQVQLLVFDISTGKWRTPYTIATVAECPDRVLVLIDEVKQQLRTFGTYPAPGGTCTSSGGAIYEKDSPLGSISFPTSKGSPVILDADSPFVQNVTSTKQNIKAGMGILVLADNNKTSRYWSHYEAPGGTTPPPVTAPTAAFTASPTSGTAPLAVQFTDTSTGSPTSWSWAFGDGATATTQNPAHTYTAAGSYVATLTATNAGGSNSTTRTITVTGAADTTPPDTTITSGPSGSVTATSASFEFSSSEAGSTFECSRDGAAYAACTSPTSYSGLAAGSHTFSVRAKDAAGNTDQSPATRSWTVGTPPPTSTGIVRQSTSTVVNTTAGTTVTVAAPSGTASGDVLVSCLALNGSTVASAPAGWSSIAGVTSVSNPRVYGYYKVAGASEPTSYSWTLASSVASSAGIARYSGASGLDGAATQASGASGTSGVVPGVTTTTANAMLVGCMGVNSSASTSTITPPADMTQAWDLGGKRHEYADGLRSAAGATGDRTWTFNASRAWAGWLVALRPR
ncbi:MAG: hypothetical protein JWR28_1124 [Modestobacter sp.]|jgi:PKD repeat protein|nr:hypothetical protein [Modestobacter sp.]MCW2617975.1 hypothetical protein [Modestobacter sp.]